MELQLGSVPAHRSKRHVNLLSFEGEKKTKKKSSNVLTDANLEIIAIISRVINSSRIGNGANNICHYG